jgi:hypothetical protein
MEKVFGTRPAAAEALCYSSAVQQMLQQMQAVTDRFPSPFLVVRSNILSGNYFLF